MFNQNSFITNGSAVKLKIVPIEHLEGVLLDTHGHLKPVEAACLNEFSHLEIVNFCHKHGVYTIPTFELLEFIKTKFINPDKTIEIGSGNGVYARNLGIRGTDNFMQHIKNERKFPGVSAYYSAFGQPAVFYGDDVEEIDGQEAVRKYKAETVFCSWVTHKYRVNRHELGGNMYGVDFEWILKRAHTKRVILVGNKKVHQNNPIMKLEHEEIELPEFIFSRAFEPGNDRVFIWNC